MRRFILKKNGRMILEDRSQTAVVTTAELLCNSDKKGLLLRIIKEETRTRVGWQNAIASPCALTSEERKDFFTPVAEDCTRHEAWTSFKEFDRFHGMFLPKELTNIGIDRAYLHLPNNFGDSVVDSGASMHIMSKEGIDIRREN